MSEERAIRKIVCDCGGNLKLDIELPDIYNSDFYNAKYKCDNCEVFIKIITRELRD